LSEGTTDIFNGGAIQGVLESVEGQWQHNNYAICDATCPRSQTRARFLANNKSPETAASVSFSFTEFYRVLQQSLSVLRAFLLGILACDDHFLR
jgi:hypothetical protein